VSRVIEGPRRLVFEAYTSAEHVAQWWGPNGFSITTRAFDFREGGVWEFTMHGPDGTDYPNRVEWREIVPPERITWAHGTGGDDFEAFESTVTLEERDGATVVTLRSVFNSREQRDHLVEQYHAIEGAEQTLSGLAEYIATLQGRD
jgi:uncharacterized protein YndB with AHSA1/START domain